MEGALFILSVPLKANETITDIYVFPWPVKASIVHRVGLSVQTNWFFKVVSSMGKFIEKWILYSWNTPGLGEETSHCNRQLHAFTSNTALLASETHAKVSLLEPRTQNVGYLLKKHYNYYYPWNISLPYCTAGQGALMSATGSRKLSQQRLEFIAKKSIRQAQ